jgi:hypothetical protein
MIQGGRILLGDLTATLPYYKGKGAPPPDDRWYYLIESAQSPGVCGYAAATVGKSERIPSCHIVGLAVPTEAGPDLTRQLVVVLLTFAVASFFVGSDGRGYVTVDVPADDLVVREAVETVGFEALSERRCGKNNTVVRYAALPKLSPETD